MIDNLIKLSELGKLLDYSDERSIKSWCKKNDIPILHAGKQSYVLSNLVDLYFQKDFESFFQAKNANGKEILEAINANDSVRLSELLDAPVTPAVKKEYKAKRKHSTACEDYLNRINRA